MVGWLVESERLRGRRLLWQAAGADGEILWVESGLSDFTPSPL